MSDSQNQPVNENDVSQAGGILFDVSERRFLEGPHTWRNGLVQAT